RTHRGQGWPPRGQDRTRGRGWAARTPASAASSAASAARRGGLARRRDSPVTTSQAPPADPARWAVPAPRAAAASRAVRAGRGAPVGRGTAAGRAADPCPRAREPARSPPGATPARSPRGAAPAPLPRSGSLPQGRPPGRTACGRPRHSRALYQPSSSSPPRGRRSSRTATRPAVPPQAAVSRTAATGTGPNGSSASTPPAIPSPGRPAGVRGLARPSAYGLPDRCPRRPDSAPALMGHPPTAQRPDAAAATAPDRRDPGREASGSWATPARAAPAAVPARAAASARPAAPARAGHEDDPLTSKAFSQSAQTETDGRSYRVAARRSQAQAKLTEQAETFITGGYQQSGQYQAGRTGEYWQYRDDAPTTVTRPPAGRYQAPGGQGPGSQVPGSQGPGATGGRPAQPGRGQAVNGHGQRPGHGGPPGHNSGRQAPGLPAAGLN